MRRIIAFFASAWLLMATIAYAQSPTTSRYKVLSTNRVSTAELAKATKRGYRVATLAQTTPGFLVLERSNDKREYLVTVELLKDIRERKVPPGYRILPQTVRVNGNGVAGYGSMTSAVRNRTRGPCEGIFERSSGDRGGRDYRVEHALYVRNLRRDILSAAAEGYHALVIRAGAGYCAVFERGAQAVSTSASLANVRDRSTEKNLGLGAADDSRPYVLIATRETNTLQKELTEAVAHGYRLHSGSAGDEFVYLMERQANAPLADYVLLSTRSIETLERSMNQAATLGYHLHPFTLGAIVFTPIPDFSIRPVTEIVAVMERRESPALEYRVIRRAAWLPQFEKEINAAGEQGWELTATLGSGAALMQRPAGSR